MANIVATGASRNNFNSKERWRILKNILMIGIAFMIHFTAFMGASNLQSSINADDSLGTFTLASIYGSLIFSNIFLPVLMISWLGCKWTISLSFIAYIPFIAAQFYPKFMTMIPAGLAVGLGGGPLWCAKCTYLTVVAEAYATVSELGADVLVTRFFGLFFMFYQMAQVWGNLISSAVLSYGKEDLPIVELNSTKVSEICGANFCQIVEENPNLAPPAPERIHLISGIYLGCMVLASLIVAFGVDSLSRIIQSIIIIIRHYSSLIYEYQYDKGRTGSATGQSGLKLLAVTLKLLKEKRQLLILPITMFIGAEQAFLFADYNAVTNAIAALATGSIVKLTGRIPVVVFAFLLHLLIIVALLYWKPTPEQGVMFFLMSGLWGICDAIWLVQVNALSGILFPGMEEAAYSNFRLWEATGSVVAYSYSSYLCTSTKLYVLIGILIVGVVGYGVIEFSGKSSKVRLVDPKTDFELVGNRENNNDK
ncbi:GSCOCG00005055001-RA-CDS [Cotesia congregata]|nr:GSCOCG00005055001-RA-CDS [Cotesia congregata]